MANITAYKSTLVNGTVDSGSLSDTFTQNGTDYVINEPTGTPATEISPALHPNSGYSGIMMVIWPIMLM
ncbi:MAG: hypothetical protein ACXABF_17305 [Candidatus Thorarchaeota archaeon]|jgi:hypothetical protein